MKLSAVAIGKAAKAQSPKVNIQLQREYASKRDLNKCAHPFSLFLLSYLYHRIIVQSEVHSEGMES